MLTHALSLAARGFHVFPVKPGAKAPPLIKDFPEHATRDEAAIRRWWEKWPAANVGVSTSRFMDDQALVVIDVDNKGEKHGGESLIALELQGCSLPSTYGQRTPSGGSHYVLMHGAALRQGVDVFGHGLDCRSAGGYFIGAGSEVAGGRYAIAHDGGVAPAPEWVVERCGVVRERAAGGLAATVDADAAVARATHYLCNEAPVSVKGQGGDQTAYRVAARLKDLGVDAATALDLMLSGAWHDGCGWSADRLREKVEHAYRYGQEAPGSAAPEAVFTATTSPADTAAPTTPHPFDKLNQEFALVIAGGGSHILWETRDVDGKPTLQHLDIPTFHRLHAPKKMNTGKKDEKVTELWMESPRRRSYDGICFLPAKQAPARFYNLWRGYACEPAEPGSTHPAVDAFLAHAKDNVCRGDDALFRWLCGYFAHLVQRPWEKPLVSLVFRGGKGVGKNALIERVGALLGGHFLVTSNRRYLIGNFNGHLENLLLFTLDEAFWSGDKQAEGQLKDLITGSHHVIEHKGKEPYRVENRTRVCIIGNEDWLVPASHDERRFAVFDVGDARKQDRAFFQRMREGMEGGGYAVLLCHLLGIDLAGVDVNEAPATDALLQQKQESLGHQDAWWLDCLSEGAVAGGDMEAGFGGQVECERLRAAYARWAREKGRGKYQPTSRAFGRSLHKVCPGVVATKARIGGVPVNVYKLPALDEARRLWDKFIGQPGEWAQ